MKGVEEAIFVSVGWLRKVVMAELNSVGDKYGFCGDVDDLDAAVVFQGKDNVEAVAGAEGPGDAGGGRVVYEYAASDGAEGVASKLKGKLKYSHADVRGAMVDWRRRLSDSSV